MAQLGFGTTPWLISLWVDAPARYGLWALGLALDFLILFTVSGTRTLGAATRRVDRLLRRRADRERTPAPSVEAAYTNTPHLAERLGLYVIIVLGEGVSQVVSAASDTTRDPGTVATALGAFTLLVGVWSLSLLQGFAGIPHLRAGVLPLRRTMLLHGVSTGLIGALAAGLGAAVAAREAVPPGNRWLLCGAVAAWSCVVLIGDLTAGRPSMGTFVRALPGPAVALVLGALGDRIGIAVLVWVLAATVILHAMSGRSIGRRPPPAVPGDCHRPSS
ncbi:low temperature requirement protein A [Embleya sp. NPDC056575]|uniref:low temperature requirement protein A n=1 Tax=unclassified Embleya TaxID=2699296 RepID=UPI0036C838B9